MTQPSDSSRELSLTRIFRAPRALVLKMWSDPDLIGKWWGPFGFTTTTRTFEFRPGGVWDFTMHGPDGTDYPNFIRFVKTGPDEIHYRHGCDSTIHLSDFEVHVRFEELADNQTQMEFRMVFPSAEERARIVETNGADKGLQQTTARLETLLTEAQVKASVAISGARQAFQMSIERLQRILEATPDDRLHWSPAATARTPLAQVVHAATSIGHIHNMLMGNRYPTPTREEADAEFLALEREVTKREEALELLNRNSQAFLTWLDHLEPERLGDMVPLPFDLGIAPLEFMLVMPAWHTNDHAAQMDYIQTCYGDRRWN